jgi:hypothetical protein
LPEVIFLASDGCPISGTEQDAMKEAKWGVFDMTYGNPPAGSRFYEKGMEELAAANAKFQLGVQENASLINWLQTD